MDTMDVIRRQHVKLMQLTCTTLGNIISGVSQEAASSYRDGPDGWTVLEVLGHLRDFDGFFRHRAEMMLARDYPHLPAYDHEALAIERAYNQQDLMQVYAEFSASRQQSIEFFKGLSTDQWARTGVHPEHGHFTVTHAAMQVGIHDAMHIEQITRILQQVSD